MGYKTFLNREDYILVKEYNDRALKELLSVTKLSYSDFYRMILDLQSRSNSKLRQATEYISDLTNKSTTFKLMTGFDWQVNDGIGYEIRGSDVYVYLNINCMTNHLINKVAKPTTDVGLSFHNLDMYTKHKITYKVSNSGTNITCTSVTTEPMHMASIAGYENNYLREKLNHYITNNQNSEGFVKKFLSSDKFSSQDLMLLNNTIVDTREVLSYIGKTEYLKNPELVMTLDFKNNKKPINWQGLEYRR